MTSLDNLFWYNV